MFDPKKPVATRGGKSARILATDARTMYGSTLQPIIAEIMEPGGGFACRSFSFDGRFGVGIDENDLVNVPEPQVLYINVYPKASDACVHPSREEADQRASPRRTGCVKVTIDHPRFDA